MRRDSKSIVASHQHSDTCFTHSLNGQLCRLKLCGVTLMLRTAGFKTEALVMVQKRDLSGYCGPDKYPVPVCL